MQHWKENLFVIQQAYDDGDCQWSVSRRHSNGHYKVSKARGVNINQNDNSYNLKSFETGLTEVSKKVFSTKSYIFQEGQYLSTDTIENWLGRKTKSNPTGLNAAQGKRSDPNPEYVQQIEEQDFMQQNGNSLTLKGITIGIGINSVYYYQKTTDGPTYQKKLSDAEIQKQGKIAAQKILTRLRKSPRLKTCRSLLHCTSKRQTTAWLGAASLPIARTKAIPSRAGRN